MWKTTPSGLGAMWQGMFLVNRAFPKTESTANRTHWALKAVNWDTAMLKFNRGGFKVAKFPLDLKIKEPIQLLLLRGLNVTVIKKHSRYGLLIGIDHLEGRLGEARAGSTGNFCSSALVVTLRAHFPNSCVDGGKTRRVCKEFSALKAGEDVRPCNIDEELARRFPTVPEPGGRSFTTLKSAVRLEQFCFSGDKKRGSATGDLGTRFICLIASVRKHKQDLGEVAEEGRAPCCDAVLDAGDREPELAPNKRRKSFSKNCNARRHESGCSINTKQSTLTCEQCTSQFGRRDSLKRHLSSCDGLYPKTAKQCRSALDTGALSPSATLDLNVNIADQSPRLSGVWTAAAVLDTSALSPAATSILAPTPVCVASFQNDIELILKESAFRGRIKTYVALGMAKDICTHLKHMKQNIVEYNKTETHDDNIVRAFKTSNVPLYSTRDIEDSFEAGIHYICHKEEEYMGTGSIWT
ncbi:hypothetical protein PR048_012263 [Dryococelus australis]|uniref:C2H2-type domain-containing protein n=1 Tax=Dryococelus australis TaxID=614101 RepID=A0ABQ9HP95_9NEOP|nr:hypothetical protein PR048_012263 [Dryococelus australis]